MGGLTLAWRPIREPPDLIGQQLAHDLVGDLGADRAHDLGDQLVVRHSQDPGVEMNADPGGLAVPLHVDARGVKHVRGSEADALDDPPGPELPDMGIDEDHVLQALPEVHGGQRAIFPEEGHDPRL
jgi:hypothetical protein